MLFVFSLSRLVTLVFQLCTANIGVGHNGIIPEIKFLPFAYRCIKRLCDLHIAAENFTEAGYTTLKHAELLKVINQQMNGLNYQNVHQNIPLQVKYVSLQKLEVLISPRSYKNLLR